jgi:hypothetical protein
MNFTKANTKVNRWLMTIMLLDLQQQNEKLWNEISVKTRTEQAALIKAEELELKLSVFSSLPTKELSGSIINQQIPKKHYLDKPV